MSISTLLLEKYGPESLHTVFKAPLKSLVERRIIKASAGIRKDPKWTANLDNEEMRQQWAETAAKEHEATEKDMAYIFAELEYYKALQIACGNKAVQGGVDMVWIKDIPDDDALAEEIKKYANFLEDVPEREKDWNYKSRGTDRQDLPARIYYFREAYESKVLLLIDPSVYPLNYSTTRLLLSPIESPTAALHFSTFGTMPGSYAAWSKAITELNKSLKADKAFYLAPEKSKTPLYCWLPADIHVEMDGSVSINSYINNLHPTSHAVFYSILSKVLAKTVPLLEQVLTDVVHPLEQRVIVNDEECVTFTAYHPEYDRRGDIDMSIYPDGDLDDAWDTWKNGISYTELAPEPFVEPKRPLLPYTLHGQDLQMVVKMINIYLTLDNPKHITNGWQELNVDNEKVVAIAMYYYDVENIECSPMQFRDSIGDEEGMCDYIYDAQSKKAFEFAFGYSNDIGKGYKYSQEVGGVEIKNGRIICFPNSYQYTNPPMQLIDSSKPGHAKILVFYFVHPGIRIPSTSIVGPQQQDWWAQGVFDVPPLSGLPTELCHMIQERVEMPMALTAARKARLDTEIAHHDTYYYQKYDPYVHYGDILD